VDAAQFREWGVTYMKYDGCNVADPKMFPNLYRKLGLLLNPGEESDNNTPHNTPPAEHNSINTPRNTPPAIVYSCSWPAYLGDAEEEKPYKYMRDSAKCDTWRNWDDIDNTWGSLRSIIVHWAKNTKTLEDGSGIILETAE
jgi:alpha-N-acetylgalactosaminidase